MKNTRKNIIKLLNTMAIAEEKAQHKAGEANDTVEFEKRKYSAALCRTIASIIKNESTYNIFKECYDSIDGKGED